jgi:hypothetical protein
VDGGEALVACADVVVAVDLEVAEEANEALEGEIGEHEPGDPTSLVCGDEHQEQPDRVTVAAH